MIKETLLGLMGGALCLSTTFATETIQPVDVNTLIGLSAQDDDDSAGVGTTGHVHHRHHGHHGADADSEHGPHLRISAGVNLISDTDIKDSNDGIKWDAGVEFNMAYGFALVGDLALELGVGMAYNSMKESYDNTGQTGNVDGELWQIPVMAHLVYEFHLGDSLVLLCDHSHLHLASAVGHHGPGLLVPPSIISKADDFVTLVVLVVSHLRYLHHSLSCPGNLVGVTGQVGHLWIQVSCSNQVLEEGCGDGTSRCTRYSIPGGSDCEAKESQHT